MAQRFLEYEDLKEWQKWLVSLDNVEVKNTQGRILRSAGLRVLEHIDDLTPVRTGRLRNSMTMGGMDNVFRLQVGKNGFIVVGTNVEYAQAVNDGFQQVRGTYVPGYWRGGKFIYDAAHPSGIRLSGKFIAGAHMFERGLDDLQADLPRIIEYELERLYALLF